MCAPPRSTALDRVRNALNGEWRDTEAIRLASRRGGDLLGEQRVREALGVLEKEGLIERRRMESRARGHGRAAQWRLRAAQ